ncbi:MAG: hypothetical protein FWC34_01085 [Bacteroidetes bacterium]|nr:hypothetical protein [Bacteroidota bacterium]MCL2302332.1 hypothetical protein [Lentimicrobiaceae bacterium]
MKKIGICIVFVLNVILCFAQYSERDTSMLIFEDSSTVKVSVYMDQFERIHYNEISYYLIPFNREKALIKYEKHISNRPTYTGYEQCTKFDLTIYPNFSKERAFTYSKPVDRFEYYPHGNCLLAQIDACCGIPSICELSTIKENRTFLKYNHRFYKIQIVEPLINIYIGIETYPNVVDTNTLVFAKLYYSIDQNVPDTVLLKVKEKSDFKKFMWEYPPTLTFHPKCKSCDRILEGPDFENAPRMIVYSLKNIQDYSEINDIGVKLFSDYPNREEIILKFVNGKIPHKEIIVEF